MNAFDQYEVWFVTGAQLLYGGDAVIAVDAHSNEMVNGLNESGKLPVKVVYKGTANSSKDVYKRQVKKDQIPFICTIFHPHLIFIIRNQIKKHLFARSII